MTTTNRTARAESQYRRHEAYWRNLERRSLLEDDGKESVSGGGWRVIRTIVIGIGRGVDSEEAVYL
jgi:hypothetical protein